MREQAAANLEATNVGLRLTPTVRGPVAAYNILPGDVLYSFKAQRPRPGDDAPYVYNSTANLVFPKSKIDNQRGETKEERAINYFYSTIWVVGLCKSQVDYAAFVSGQTSNPPLALRAGIVSTINYSAEEINAGDELIVCINPKRSLMGNVQGFDPSKMCPELRPLSVGLLFPSVGSISQSWRVTNPMQLLETTARLRPLDPGARAGMDRDSAAPMESDFPSTRVGINDVHVALERFVKTVAMHTIALYRAHTMPAPAGGAGGGRVNLQDFATIKPEVIVGLARPTVQEADWLKLTSASCTNLKQTDWQENTLFSKALLSLSLGYDYDRCRSDKPSVKSCEMSGYNLLISAFADSVKSVMARHIGTSVSHANPGSKFTVHINI